MSFAGGACLRGKPPRLRRPDRGSLRPAGTRAHMGRRQDPSITAPGRAPSDGWCPFGITALQAQDWLSRVALPSGFDVILGPDRPFDPIQAPEATMKALSRLGEAGATVASARFVHHSLQHYLEQLEALAELHSRS